MDNGYAHGKILRHILDKIMKLHFQSTSNEVIWSQKMSGKKGHFGNFSDWAGMAVPC